MLYTRTADDAASPRWCDLPSDLLREVSRRLHVAADYVRFHAVCTPWHDALPPAPRRPALLPWLLASRDATGHRRARCVPFSPSPYLSKTSRRYAAATIELRVRDRGWVVRPGDGAAALLLAAATSPDNPGGAVAVADDPLTGSAAATTNYSLPPWSDGMDAWADHATVAVSGDGTILLYPFESAADESITFNVALLYPGDTAWTLVQRHDLYVNPNRCCVAYHNGDIVQCNVNSWSITAVQPKAGNVDHLEHWVNGEPGEDFLSGYLVESRGELLWACVRVKSAYDRHGHYGGVAVDDKMVRALSVAVYVLRDQEADGGSCDEARWVKLDGRSLADRVLFLGRPSSFALDATRIGFDGGCAYFVIRSHAYWGIWYRWGDQRCRLFKYSFRDHRTEFLEQLPNDWNHEASCMWLTPQPAIASTEEIEGTPGVSNRKATKPDQTQYGAYFRIYVGNVPRKMDSYRLRQLFSKHGKVADARVMCHRKTGRSRGFGFVTMAIEMGNEPSDAIAKLNGQCLDGRILRVKFADPELVTTAGSI